MGRRLGSSVVVVTGGSAGVGRATAVAFARRGASVGVLARGEAGLAAAVVEIERCGGHGLALPTDMADPAAVDAAAEEVERRLGPIDIWVNNAMTTVFAYSWDVTPEEYRRATEVTYLGQVHGTLAALRRMRPRDQGTVCNVGSALAFRAIPLQAAYCGAKFAARGFTEAVRAELRHDGSHVQITTVHLPAVDTPQFGWCRSRLPKHPQPVPPTYAPEVAAEAIVAASLRPRRQKVLGGFNHLVVAASKVAPGILDHYVARTTVAAQQAAFDASPDRPDNLWAPVDGEGGADRGARGIFADQEGGMANRRWLASVPALVAEVGHAAFDRLREVAGRP